MKKLIMILLALLASTQIHAVTRDNRGGGQLIIWFTSDEVWDLQNNRKISLVHEIKEGMTGREIYDKLSSSFSQELARAMDGFVSDDYVVVRTYDELGSHFSQPRGPSYRWGVELNDKQHL